MIYGTSEMLCDKGCLISLVIHLQFCDAVVQHITITAHTVQYQSMISLEQIKLYLTMSPSSLSKPKT